MSAFSYHRISSDFIRGLADEVQLGESAILVGPRYSGKRHVLSQLRSLFQDRELKPVVEISFLDEGPVYSENQLQRIIDQAVTEAVPEFSGLSGIENSQGGLIRFLGLIEKIAKSLGKPVVMLAANVDGVAHHLARSFLEDVRNLEEKQQLVVVLTGENDFHELIYGPNSEFSCANQFVVQGYEENEFWQSLSHYLTHFRITFDSPSDMRRHLWAITGGNLYLLRIIFWILVQIRADNGIDPDRPLVVTEIPTTFRIKGAPKVYGAHIFRHATLLIDREPTCWNDLESLIQKTPVTLGVHENAPSVLELAGVAVRKSVESRAELEFASSLMEDFVKQYYDEKSFGDLYAGIGEWDKAFEYFRRLHPERRVRPVDSADRTKVEATINALDSSLYWEATRASEVDANLEAVIDDIKARLVNGARYVLGFNEVTFWNRESWQRNAKWQNELKVAESLPRSIIEIAATLLPTDKNLTQGLIKIPEPWNRYAVAAILPGIRRDEHAAVMVSHLDGHTSISRDRERLVKQLLAHFVKAYTHAITVDGIQIRRRVRERQIAVLNSIFNSLGSHELSVQKLLQMAADGISTLEYSRVLFSLVTPDHDSIELIYEKTEQPLTSLRKPISYSLANPTEDIQTFVIHQRQEMIVEDARFDPLMDKEVVRASRMKAFAIIPIINPANDAIGTIIVERKNGAAPSKEEVADLKVFGKQLAIALEQCQRINLLETGLNRIPDPIFIVDRRKRPRYANQAASDLLKIPLGSVNPSSDISPLTEDAGPILKVIDESLACGYRLASHIEGIGRNKEYYGAVFSSVVPDWRGGTIGGLVRIQDVTYLNKVFEALLHTAEAEDTDAVIHYMLEAAGSLGPRWGRLYLVEPDADGIRRVPLNSSDPMPLFRSVECFGYAAESVAREFRQGKVVLRPTHKGDLKHWLCITRGEPIVFCWKKDLQEDEEFVTAQGLKAINWAFPTTPKHLKKNPGDFWIDFPLLTTEYIFGKICLQCDEDLQPENFVYLKVLSETFARLLDAFLSFDKKRKTISIEVAERTMATLAHDIGARIASLWGVLANYRDIAKTIPQLEANNEKFKRILRRARVAINRANMLLVPINPEVTSVNLVEFVETILASTLPAESYEVQSLKGCLQIEVDTHLLETVMLELVQNSRNAIDKSANLMISVLLNSNHLQTQRGAVTITYRDNGPGVPEDLSERIFEEFFSQRPGKKTGTGLGLGFVRRVIEAHNGFVFYNTAKMNDGAEFVIALPYKFQPKEKKNVSHPNRGRRRRHVTASG